MGENGMTDKLETNRKKFTLSWPILLGLLVALPLLCCGSGFLLIATGHINLFPHTDVSDKDYETNAEKLKVVNSVLPIALPANTNVNRFRIEGFQELELTFEGVLPTSEIEPFTQSLPALDKPMPDTFKGNIGANPIEIRIDKSTGEIWIEYLDL
jgi:hypothetical protein